MKDPYQRGTRPILRKTSSSSIRRALLQKKRKKNYRTFASDDGIEEIKDENQVLEERKRHHNFEYSVEEVPPWHITSVYAVQQILANIGGAISVVYIVHGALCTKGREGSDVLFAQMINATVFIMGISSLIQTALGIRLPIVQGSSATFIAPIIAMMNTQRYVCPGLPNNTTGNASLDDLAPWEPRLAVISGSLMAASAFQIIFGMTGIMGCLMNFIGPLTVIPTVSLVGFTLFGTATAGAQHQWGICILTISMIVVFSLVLNNIGVPLPSWSRGRGCYKDKYRIFRLFPHIFAISIAWTLSYILTVSNVFPRSSTETPNPARTDAKYDVMYKAEWFLFPYPGRICGLDFDWGVFAGMAAAIMASIIESVGDYYATAQICHLPPPPKHAVNRGIFMEGLSSLLAGATGIAHATTSYSSTIGFIAVTGMASRWVWQVMSLILIVLGMFGKFGAALAMIPDPIIGGLTVVALGMVTSIAMSNIKHVDMGSSRNLMILALAHMFGMMLPFWLRDNPHAINTGIEDLDQVLTVLLSTGMLVGGAIGCILDNILPGTKEERGIISFLSEQKTPTREGLVMKTYELPYITPCVAGIKCCSIMPLMPGYQEAHCCICCSCMRQPDLERQIEIEGLITAATDIP